MPPVRRRPTFYPSFGPDPAPAEAGWHRPQPLAHPDGQDALAPASPSPAAGTPARWAPFPSADGPSAPPPADRLSRAIERGETAAAWSAFCHLRAGSRNASGIAPSTIGRLLTLLAARGDAWPAADFLLASERVAGHPVPAPAFRTALVAAAVAGDMALARRLCEAHTGHAARHCDYHVMLRGVASLALPTALAVLRDMAAHQRPPGLNAYSILLRGRVAAGELDQAEDVLTFLEEGGPSPPRGLYKFILDASRAVGDVARGEAILARMRRQRVPFCRPTYDTAIAMLADHGRLDDALALFGEMLADGLTTGRATLAPLWRAATAAGNAPLTLFLAEQASRHRLELAGD